MAMSPDMCFALLEQDEDVLQVETNLSQNGVCLIDMDSSEEPTIWVPAHRISGLIELLTKAQAHLQGHSTEGLVTLHGSIRPAAEGFIDYDLEFIPEAPESHKSAIANAMYHTAWELLGIDPQAEACNGCAQ